METIAAFLNRLDELIWGPWLITLIIGTGIFLMIRLHFLPIRNFFYALTLTIGGERSSAGAISPLSSLTTELAATIGTGNIVGVATAMILGGPGALVWMLLSSLIGLSTNHLTPHGLRFRSLTKYRRANGREQRHLKPLR